ncbi:MAG: PIN domain-containing protein [Chloroflexi bacterium]|nr:PIN domain-containing protein [Chloroflexota bacterium]
MSVRFLDTNILLRYLTKDDEKKAKAAFALLQRVEQGKEKVATSSMVVFETVFTLDKQYRFPRGQIREAILDILSLRGLELPNKGLYEQVFDLYANRNISFADAFNAAYMASREMVEIYSYDTDFDKLPDIKRVEP